MILRRSLNSDATGCRIGGSRPSMVQGFFFLQDVENDSGAHTAGAFTKVKWPGRVADHTSPCGAHVKNECSYSSTPRYACMVWTGTTLLRPNETQIIGLSSVLPDSLLYSIICYQKKTLDPAVRVYGEA
jgi:hypothetical protein